MVQISSLSAPHEAECAWLLEPATDRTEPSEGTAHTRSTLLVASWLLDRHFVLQDAFQESSLDVQLVHNQVLQRGHSQQSSEGKALAQKSKHLIHFHAFFLTEALGNQPCLEAVYVSIGILLDVENLLDRQWPNGR